MADHRNPGSPSPRAFVSYARADGESFATSLRERLECEESEITLWQDRARLEGGVGWWQQITEALDEVEFLIMVMTPAVTASEIARKEWRYARQQGVRICPVLGVRAQELDFGSLPSWMRKVHFYDLEKEWETFIGFLKSHKEENRVPFMAPDLRDDFVERPREFGALLSQILDRSRMNPLAITTALQGSGGFGKTTLAIALCHDADVTSAFDDGILWATLGETPRLQQELTKLYAALTGERPPFVDVDDASIELAAKLDGRSCLIVIDDVWDANDVKPFLRGGHQCARLITTRRLQVVTEVDAHRVFVDEMTQDQAVQMLMERLPRRPDNASPFLALARRLGEWPLLLKLTASQLRERIGRGDSLQGALAYVNRALDKRGVVAFDRANPSERGDAVATTIAASLALLAHEDRTRCAELAIFSGERLLPVSAARALWGLDDFDTEELLQRLDDAALVDFDVKTGSIRLHDVLHAHLRSQLSDQQSVHSRLVHSGWSNHHALPDSYAWRSIGWHLACAGELEYLKSLLLDITWLEAKLAATDVQAVLQDFELEPDSGDLRILRDALRLAINGLSRDPGQLRTQLVARLERGTSAGIDRFLEKIEASPTRPWLRVLHTSLAHPGGSLVTILKGHTGAVESLAISPDGRWAASGGSDWTIRIWDMLTWRHVRILQGHEGLIHSLAITSDGRCIASASEDRSLRIWDSETGQLIRVLKGHSGAVYGVAVGSDHRTAVSISEDGTVRVWDITTGLSCQAFNCQSHQLRAIALTADGERALFGAGDWTLQVLELKTGRVVRTFNGHTGNVRAVAIMPDGGRVLTGGDDCTLRMWDAETGSTVAVLRGHEDGVECVAVTPCGKRAVSGGRDKTLRLWDLEAGEQLQVLDWHAGSVGALVTSPSGSQMLSGSGDKTLCLWNLDGAGTPQAQRARSASVSLLSISADGQKVVSGSQSGNLTVWHPGSNRIVGVLEGHGGPVESVWMTADGHLALTGSRDRTLRVWDLQTGCALHILTGHRGAVLRTAMAPDGPRALSLSFDRTIRVWDLDTGRELRVLVGIENVRALTLLREQELLTSDLMAGPAVDTTEIAIRRDGMIAISPNGRHALYAHQGRSCVWDLDTGDTRLTPLGDRRGDPLSFDATAIVIDDASQFAVIGSRFGTLCVLDLEQSERVRILETNVSGVLDLVISADGCSLIMASRDDFIRIWDLASGRERSAFAVCGSQVDAVVIGPKGGLAYSVYGDTIVASNLTKGVQMGSVSFDHQITAIAVVPDGKRLALGDESGRVHFLCLQCD